ncbi:MAG: class F sortase [Actinomycetota bacterium]|nr:class F sortase [Actinomycetota bacterium]
MTDPEGKRSKLKRRGLWSAALLCVVGPGAAAALLGSSDDPAPLVAARSPDPPLKYVEERPRPRRAEPKRKQESKPKRRPNLKVRIDDKAAAPVAVTVPSAGIAAPVIPLGLQRNGKIEVPENIVEAGWWKRGPEPGERGAAMITAHVNGDGRDGAFANLASVGEGDKVRVRRRDGTTVAFEVDRTERVPKGEFPTKRVYGKTRLPTLRLVTCGGTFDSTSGHYRDNVIVYATRMPS